jgi:hypothetical protein
MVTKKVWGKSRKNISQKEEELSSVNGFLSKETEFLEPDSLHADTIKFLVSISTKVSSL